MGNTWEAPHADLEIDEPTSWTRTENKSALATLDTPEPENDDGSTRSDADSEPENDDDSIRSDAGSEPKNDDGSETGSNISTLIHPERDQIESIIWSDSESDENNNNEPTSWTDDELDPDTVAEFEEMGAYSLNSFNYLEGMISQSLRELHIDDSVLHIMQLSLPLSTADDGIQELISLMGYRDLSRRNGRKIKIDELKTFTVTAENDVECPVCLEIFVADDKVKRLTCSHMYHEKCLAMWIFAHDDCPYCRQPIHFPLLGADDSDDEPILV